MRLLGEKKWNIPERGGENPTSLIAPGAEHMRTRSTCHERNKGDGGTTRGDRYRGGHW